MSKGSSALTALAVGLLAYAATSNVALARDQISIVGSSTVFPFATTVAERFGNAGHSNSRSPEKPGWVWNRKQLLDRVWGREKDVDSRAVDVHIGRLRKVLRQQGNRDPIRTVRGTGYSLDMDF